MANTIGWGSGAANNSIGWGQGKTNNTIDWGEIYDLSPSGETDLVGVIPPTSLTSPVVSGSGVVGQTLSTTDGTWSGTLPITFAYQWNRNGSIILGATNNTYTLVTADGSTSITCTVTATNAGGSVSKNSNAISVAAATDADANAFIAAAAITDATQKAAIDKLVVDLKGYGIWTKMKALYPFVGGSAAQHKFNLRNPVDSDAAFRLVFNGGWVHSNTGALPNGTNSYANTFFRPNNWTNINNAHMSYYSRTNVNGAQVEIGLFALDGNGNSNNSLAVRYNDSFQSLLNLFGNNGWLLVGNTNSLGQFMANRYVTNSLNSWKNGVKQGEISSTPSINTGNTYNYTLGSYNYNGGAEAFSTKQAAFASFGDGLTDTEAANYYTAVQTFQTTLSRNV